MCVRRRSFRYSVAISGQFTFWRSSARLAAVPFIIAARCDPAHRGPTALGDLGGCCLAGCISGPLVTCRIRLLVVQLIVRNHRLPRPTPAVSMYLLTEPTLPCVCHAFSLIQSAGISTDLREKRRLVTVTSGPRGDLEAGRAVKRRSPTADVAAIDDDIPSCINGLQRLCKGAIPDQI